MYITHLTTSYQTGPEKSFISECKSAQYKKKYMNTNELPWHPGIMPCADSCLCMKEVDLALLSSSLF